MSHWVLLSKAAVLSKIPDRTLRDKALKGKIRVKKEGKYWMCDLISMKEAKLISDEALKEHLGQLPPEKMLSLPSQMTTPPSIDTSQRKGKRSYNINTLGVYSDLLAVCKSSEMANLNNPQVHEYLVESLTQLGFGFYEFHTNLKSNSFRKARKCLIRAMTLLQIIPESNKQNYILNAVTGVLPGVGGLIRNTEKRAHERNSRSPRPYKNREFDE